jgi:uncharacterized protein YndB with AHSA1/START domain
VNLDVEYSLLIDAAPVEVFDAFTDPEGQDALMTMNQRGFPTVELRDEHRRGVPNAFARLERIVARHGRFE